MHELILFIWGMPLEEFVKTVLAVGIALKVVKEANGRYEEGKEFRRIEKINRIGGRR